MHACAQYVMIAVSTLCYEILLPSLYTQPRRKISDVKASQFTYTYRPSLLPRDNNSILRYLHFLIVGDYLQLAHTHTHKHAHTHTHTYTHTPPIATRAVSYHSVLPHQIFSRARKTTNSLRSVQRIVTS